MPGSDQQPKGLLTFYVDANGTCQIHLGKAWDRINPDNADGQWIYRLQDMITAAAKRFIADHSIR